MTLIKTLAGCLALVAAFAVAMPAPARAQEISPSHLAAALDVVVVTQTGRNFDDVLPTLAVQVQDMLIRIRPDVHAQITAAVDTMALELVSRRAELNNDIARIWAQAFTEDELKAISVFYRSPAGAKLAGTGASVLADSVRAAQGWSERLQEELIAKSREELKRQGLEL